MPFEIVGDITDVEAIAVGASEIYLGPGDCMAQAGGAS